MLRISRYLIIKSFYIAIDIILLGCALFIACWVRQKTLSFPVTPENLFFSPSNSFRFLFLFWISVIVFANNAHGLYQTKREILETIEVWEVLKAVFFSSLMMIVVMFVIKVSYFPRSILLLATILAFVFLSVWRAFKRLVVEYLVIGGYNNFNVLVIGAGKIGSALVEEIRKKPALGLNVVGYLDDFKTAKEGEPKILGKISDFSKIARREFIDKIFIACHCESENFLKLLEQARELGVAVRVVPHGFELMSGEFSKYNIGFIPILEYCDQENYHKQAGKRIFDFLAGICLVFAALPVFLVLAILIKWDSPGPVLYLSKRYGRGGKKFNMYKFRSMRADADRLVEQMKEKNEVDGPIFKIKRDARITRIGRLLRRYSLDELPQLLNVIKGDMSLVGPRPLPISQVEREDFRQLRRLDVRPGITGLWQIRGRSDISFARLVKWDIWYINNWSLWLDLNILLQTIPVVLKGRGAY
ncbi:MAG TPA: sugar transferase [Candidatus Omnitrophota bacterium]|nr:sugar transferase [Candidatus Omnitrophota bacterium]